MKYRECRDRELKLKFFQRPQSTLSFNMQIKYIKGIIRKAWLYRKRNGIPCKYSDSQLKTYYRLYDLKYFTLYSKGNISQWQKSDIINGISIKETTDNAFLFKNYNF